MSAALENKFAYARLHPDHTVPAYNTTSSRFCIHAPLAVAPGANTLSGKVHIAGPTLATMLGQTTVDLAHLQSIDFHDATTNVSEPVGVHMSIGTGETESTFATVDRVHHVGQNEAVTACHAVVGPSSSNGTVQTYSNLGSVDVHFANDANAQTDTRHALGRCLRWSGQQASKSMAGSCTSVGLGDQQRWLVPTEQPDLQCSMSTLFAVNSDKTEFCGSRYAETAATFANDQKGRRCKVVTAQDFKDVQTALKSRFAEKNPLKNGLTFNFETFNDGAGGKMSASMVNPTVTLNGQMNRMTTEDFLAQDMNANAAQPAMTTADMHSLLGETAPAVTATTLADSPSSFAQTIMGLELTGQPTSGSSSIAMSATNPIIAQGED